MNYVYIDESGDLGFNEKGSNFFTISACLITDEITHKKFKRIPKKIRTKKLNKKLKKQSELKFSNSSHIIRKNFLLMAADLDIKIYSIIINKSFTKDELKSDVNILYNYLLKILLEKVLLNIDVSKKLLICLDNCMTSSQKENFESYIKTEFFSLFQKLSLVNISHEVSHTNPCLQVIDFICGAFGYKYNTKNLGKGSKMYTDIINCKIEIEKNDLFKEKQ